MNWRVQTFSGMGFNLGRVAAQAVNTLKLKQTRYIADTRRCSRLMQTRV